jgi:hypothetical protein
VGFEGGGSDGFGSDGVGMVEVGSLPSVSSLYASLPSQSPGSALVVTIVVIV